MHDSIASRVSTQIAILTEVGAADDLDVLVDWSVRHLDLGQ